jgi:hypothetical protein
MQAPPIPCISGWALPTNPAVLNTAGKLINATGTLLDFTFAGQALMPTTSPDGSAFFKVTNTTGVPTNLSAPSGSLAFDNVGTQLYYFNGTNWVALGSAGGDPLSAVLAVGNTTGANDIVMSSARELHFEAGIRIAGKAAPTGASAVDALAIGPSATAAGGAAIAIGQNTSASAASSIALGNGATSAFSQSVAIGANVSTTAVNQIALGLSGWTTVVPGALQLPLAAPLNSTNLLAVTTVAGTPTSVPRVGSVVMDDTNKLLYMYTTASGWVTVGAASPTPALSAVLAVGNTTGANDINITNGQQLGYATGFGVRIGLDGASTGASTSTSITIGNALTSASGDDAIAIGPDAVASQSGNVALGNGSSVTGFTSCAVGLNSTASGTNAAIFGADASAGSGVNNTVIGCSNAVAGTAADCIAVGTSINIPTGASGNVIIGSTPTISGTPSRVVALGYSNNVSGGTDTVIVGTSSVASSLYSIAVGSGVTANNNSAIAIGRTASASGLYALAIGLSAVCAAGAGVAIGNGANAGTGLANIAIGQTVTVPGVTGIYNTCIGQLSTITALGDQNIAIGTGNTVGGNASSDNNICIGSNNTLSGNTADRIAIGRGVSVSSADSVGIGRGATATAAGAVALGPAAFANSTTCTAIGNSSTASSSGATGVGHTSSAQGISCTAVGNSTATGVGANNTVIGASSTIASSSTQCTILGSLSNIPTGRTRAIALGCNVLAANVTTDNSIYTATTWATSAAGTAVSWDAATGLLHPNTSSLRYKQDLQPIKEPERVLKIEAYDYALKAGHCGCTLPKCNGLHCGRREIGAVAEQVAEVLPELVVYSLDEETRHPQPESVQYDRLSLFLLELARKQQARIEKLETEISNLTK